MANSKTVNTKSANTKSVNSKTVNTKTTKTKSANTKSANTCYIRLYVMSSDVSEACKFGYMLMDRKKKAERMGVDFMLSGNRRIIDAKVRVECDIALLEGWTNGCFNDREVVELIESILVPDADIKLIYENFERHGYGMYLYYDGHYNHEYLPKNNFPKREKPDGPGYCYRDIVHDAFVEYGTGYEI